MKIFKNKNFKALIYSIFLSLPMLTIFGRTIYTIANKNAKDSYYGETINEKLYVELNNVNDIKVNDTYNLFMVQNGSFTSQTGNLTIYFDNFVDNDNLGLSDTPDSFLYYYTNNSIAFQFRKESTLLLAGNTNTKGLNFNFSYLSSVSNELTLNDSLQYIKKIEYNKYSYLDNAFEYSIDKFTNDNNFGKLNFFQWFSDLFLNNNQVNNLYINFVNWYMNYILYVSLAYLLFAVLMWFVNFFRSLVEKNMDLDL